MIGHNADQNQTADSASAPDQGSTRERYHARKIAQQIRLYKEAAVEKVASFANLIDPLVVEAELKCIAAEHPGTYLSEKANQLLEEFAKELSEIAQREDLVNVPWEDIPTDPLGPTLQTGSSTAITTTENNTSKDANSPANKDQTRAIKGHNTTNDVTSLAQTHASSTKTSRGPPLLYIVAGLSIAGATVFLGVYWPKATKVTKSSEV